MNPIKLFLIRSELILAININLSNREAQLLLDLEPWVLGIALLLAEDDIGILLLVELDLIIVIESYNALLFEPIWTVKVVDFDLYF